MRLELSCQVNQDFLKVKAGFNESLFSKLSPPSARQPSAV